MRYTALYSGVTDDPAFSGMSMVGQLTWFFLLSCKHGNMLGLFQLPTMYAACDLHWTIEQVEAGLAEVEQSGQEPGVGGVEQEFGDGGSGAEEQRGG